MTHPRKPSVLVIGAGFGGLGVGVELLRAGFSELTILEKADDIGGVWRDNVYPGAACDVPSSLYSWSFAPNPRWGHRYARQAEILDYIHSTAQAWGVRRHVRTGCEVRTATWDESTRRWTATTTAGETFEADVLIPALGQLSRPSIPQLPGADTFAGTAFHSATWDHHVELEGKKVAVIGAGASAIQFVPGIVDRVAALTVFQRSAPYVVPKPDREYTAVHRIAFRRVPWTQALGRRLTALFSEQMNRALICGGLRSRLLSAAWRMHLLVQVPDAELRARLVPDYEIGCKRVLFSNNWYPAVSREHVDVVDQPVVGLEREGVRTADGMLHPADVLIYGTGFAATEFLAPMIVLGAGRADLHEVWTGGAHAYLGVTVPEFPNMFLVYGPNTNLGGSSIISMLEAQAHYIVQAVRALAEGRAPALEVRREVADSFDDELQQRLQDTVWRGCASWYRSEGRISTNWPGLVQEYVQRTKQLDLADFLKTSKAPV